jgi:hypothetical protein
VLNIDETDLWHVFLDNDSIASIPRECETIQHCTLFDGCENGHITCQFIHASVSTFTKSDPQPMITFVPQERDGRELINTVNRSSECATFEAEFFNHPSTFWESFESSHGVQFVVSLFSNLQYIQDLVSILIRITKHSDHAKAKLVENDAFEVIAYFLSQADKSISTLRLFVQLFGIAPLLQLPYSSLPFIKAIILNFEICQKTSDDTIFAVLDEWKQLFTNSTEVAYLFMPAYLLAFCDSLFTQKVR